MFETMFEVFSNPNGEMCVQDGIKLISSNIGEDITYEDERLVEFMKENVKKMNGKM
jgi:hypothetical protein